MRDRKRSSKKQLHLLVLTDDAADGKWLESELSANRALFTITACRTADEALHILHHWRIDLIVVMSYGTEKAVLRFYRELRGQYSEIPVVIVAQEEDELISLQALQSGIQDFLVRSELKGRSLARALRFAIERQRMVALIKKARSLERHQHDFDPLTGLPNRQHFCRIVNQAIQRVRGRKTYLAVLLIDVDAYSEPATRIGPEACNQLLKEAGRRLKAVLRDSDVVARIGSDEFAVMIMYLTNAHDLAVISKKILRVFADPFEIADLRKTITVNIGISVYPSSGESAESLLKHADLSLDSAKRAGKNRVKLYSKALGEVAGKRHALESRLRQAHDENELVMFYQPMFDMQTGEITGIEALVRWRHPELGVLSPKMFIPIAEECGLMHSIGERILSMACAQNKFWQLEGFPRVPVHVNISASQFQDGQLVHVIERVLKKTGLEPQYLELEISEAHSMQDVTYSIETLKKLKNLGVRIALDDFGTGYTSLNYLKRFPVDALKIDRSFVQGIPADQRNMAMVKSIVDLAHNLDLNVVAEGVERREQIDFLRRARCDRMQGFHFGEPLPGERVRNLFRRIKDRQAFIAEKLEAPE